MVRISKLFLFFMVSIAPAACGPGDRSEDTADEQREDSLTATKVREANTAAANSLLNRTQNRWHSTSVRDYRYTLVRGSSRSPDISSPVIVTVRDGEIVSAKYESAPEVVSIDPEKQHIPTIDSLFAFLNESIVNEPDSLSVRYDLEHGFPYAIFIDHDRKKPDDEVDVEIKDFAAMRSAPE